MLTEEKRAQILPVWAGLVSLTALYFLTANLWKALLIGAFVAGSAMLGWAARFVSMGAFAIAVLAVAVALGLPMPDQWLQAIDGVRETVFLSPR